MPAMPNPTTQSTARTLRRLAARTIALATVLGLSSGVLASGAGAGVPERYPLGSIHSLARTSAGSAAITGRAADPDRPKESVLVEFTLDGNHLARVNANRGADAHVFEANLPIDANAHTICAFGIGRGPKQLRASLGCARVGAYQAPAPVTQPPVQNPAPVTPATAPVKPTPVPVRPVPTPTAPKPTTPALPCRANAILFMPQSMRLLYPPKNTCFKWARTETEPKNSAQLAVKEAIGIRTLMTFSDNWGRTTPMLGETPNASWTIEDINTDPRYNARTPEQVKAINARYGPGGPLGFVQVALRKGRTVDLTKLGIRPRFIPAIQVYEVARGPIARKDLLAYAETVPNALPIFNVNPDNLTNANISVIREACVRFKGRIGIWSGSGAYPKPNPANGNAELNAAVEEMNGRMQVFYKAIDACNQRVGLKSAPTPGL